MTDHPLTRRIADVLGLQPEANAIEYDGQWFSWGQVGETARRIAARAAEQRDPQVGMLLRNRPGQVAAFLGVLLAGGTVVTINPLRGDDPGYHRDPDGVDFGSARRRRWAGAIQRRLRSPARGRGADVDQWNDRARQTSRPRLRYAGAQRDGPRT
jgi:acyl-CoA synthetase (AMP-forming)/AMP-acid ligase II